jgi:hypothetical protein
LAATATALFAFWQVSISRDTERRQLRAYIGVTTAPGQPIATDLLPPGRPIIQLAEKNYGLTPAYHVIQEMNTTVFSYPLPKGYRFGDIHDYETIENHNHVTINPGLIDLYEIVLRSKKALTEN